MMKHTFKKITAMILAGIMTVNMGMVAVAEGDTNESGLEKIVSEVAEDFSLRYPDFIDLIRNVSDAYYNDPTFQYEYNHSPQGAKETLSRAIEKEIDIEMNKNIIATAPVESGLKTQTIDERIADILSIYYADIDTNINYSYGDEIPLYKYNNGILNKAETLRIYPVYINGLLSGYVKETMCSGNSYLSYSEELAERVIDFNFNNYSFVYSGNCLYIMNPEKVEFLFDYRNGDETSDESVCTLDLNHIDFSDPYKAVHTLNVSPLYSVYDSINSAGDENISLSLNIPAWKQPAGSSYCWAGCVEAVGEYMTGNKALSPEQIASYMGMGFSDSGNNNIMKEALKKYYKIETEDSTAIRSFSYVYYKITFGKPIIANMQYNEQGENGHALTVIGCGATSNAYYFKYMDTNTGGYGVTTADANGSFSYEHNVTYHLTSAVVPA